MTASAKRIKYIFWDNDGIFVETEELYFQSTKETLAQVGVALSLDLYRDLLLNQARGAWFMAEEKGCSTEDIAALVVQRNNRYAELIAKRDVFVEGAVEAFSALVGLLPMAIVTSSRAEHFQLIHREQQITRHVEFVLWSGMYKASKPAPDPYLMALERSGANPEDVLVIEDSRRGLRAAHAAGLRCWVIPSQMTAGQDFSLAERVVDNIAMLPDLIKPLL